MNILSDYSGIVRWAKMIILLFNFGEKIKNFQNQIILEN